MKVTSTTILRRLTSPLRIVTTGIRAATAVPVRLRSAQRRHGGWQRLAHDVWTHVRRRGWRGLVTIIVHPQHPEGGPGATEILALSVASQLDMAERRFAPAFADAERIKYGPLISILLPTYETPVDLLQKTIGSVLEQTYENWELCIADDGSKSANVRDMLLDLIDRDKRVKVVILPRNVGISEASNAALRLSSGAFVALLDHDDLLTNDALAEVAAAIANAPEADVLYSDECRLSANGKPVALFPKPDWSPFLMLACMYMGHLMVLRRDLITEIGGFRRIFDFSQDYDLALRATERAKKVVHIPQVLYGWRMIGGSAAAGDKPYARLGNLMALQDAAYRRGWRALAVPLPMSNYLQWFGPALTDLVSIVIPSDSLDNIRAVVKSLDENTAYLAWETLIVTNSSIANVLEQQSSHRSIRYVRFDKAFNFSEKCNVGADAAKGRVLIFLNDDIRIVTKDWIERLLEILRLDGAGAVGPKMLYENGTIQHAGMVSGVRRLVGTAFHALPADTDSHYNLAQSIREVSVLCGACLAVTAETFRRIGGFDAVNTPISHSDVDLCFRIQAIGLSCVYTPHAVLTHVGHLSLAEHDVRSRVSRKRTKDKANIYLLRRWAARITNDPYFPKGMRDILYHDSPEMFDVFTSDVMSQASGRDILLITHDLSESGAPRVVLEMARALVALGHFVVVASPSDGEIRGAIEALHVPVIVDRLLLTGREPVADFGKDFDLIIANTAETWPVVRQLSALTKVIWYFHETSLVADLLHRNAGFRKALDQVCRAWAGSKLAADHLAPLGCDPVILEYGVPACPPRPAPRHLSADSTIRLSIFGSYEERKGQDLLLQAFLGLDAATRSRCHLVIYGRILDTRFRSALNRTAARSRQIALHDNLSYDAYLQALFESDLVIVPSRDDTLPLVSLNALSAGIPLMCTRTTGTSAYIEDGHSGFVAREATSESIQATLVRALAAIDRWPDIGAVGKAVFREHFSVERFSERFSAEIQKALDDEATGHTEMQQTGLFVQ